MDTAEQILQDALAQVERDCPAATAHLKEAIGATPLDIEIGAERFRLQLSPGEGGPAPEVEVRIAARDLVDILEGSLGAHDAILSDALFVRGDATALVAAAEGALWFLKGALRTRDSERLVTRLSKLPQGASDG